MAMSSRMRFVAEQQIHQTDLQMIQWCSCSRFLIAFGLSQEATKPKKFVLIAYNNWITICFSPGSTTLYRHLMKIKLTDMFRISCCCMNCAKIWENWCKNFTEVDQIQWPHVTLRMENWVFDFVARWHHLCYKSVHYRVNRFVHNKISLKSAKNHTNWFIRFEDMSSQTYSGLVFLDHP